MDMRYLKPLAAKPESYPGFSEKLVASHYANNYAGAVKRLNAIARRLDALDVSAPAFELNALKREELAAYNSMVLHEIYFEALAPSKPPSAEFAAAIARDFGAFEIWERRFAACAKALAGGSGWVVLVRENRDGRLAIQWGADHAMGFAGATPLLALDMYEHAYHLDYGAEAGRYVDAFLATIDWTGAERRWRGEVARPALHGVAAEALDGFDGVFVDARRAPAFEAGTDMLPQALRLDPADPDGAKAGLPRARKIVVYCVYGFSFSRDTAAALRAQGYDASFLDTGIVGWRAMGKPVVAKGVRGQEVR
jgi:Fe-Mn family superoxide dismutase